MSKTVVARYSVTFGLSGCYMPDSVDGPYEFHTRAELAAFIREELELYELPKHLFRFAGVKKLWQFIKRNGSSSAHFYIHHGQNVLSFSGLTEEEYNQQLSSDERDGC